MLDSLLDSRIKLMMPHIRNAAQVACAYGERIITRLDRIYESLERTDDIAGRARINGGPLTVGVPADVLNLGTGDVVCFKQIAVMSTGGAGAIIIRDQGLIRFAMGFLPTSAQPEVMFEGPCYLTIESTGTLAVTEWYAEFQRVRRPVSALLTNAPGLIESPDQFNGQVNGERDNDGRHATLVGYADNIRGTARGDGATVDPYGRM